MLCACAVRVMCDLCVCHVCVVCVCSLYVCVCVWFVCVLSVWGGWVISLCAPACVIFGVVCECVRVCVCVLNGRYVCVRCV